MNGRPGRGSSAIVTGCAGFTLAEIAITMLIVGLLLASAFVPLTAQVELRNIAETQRTMEAIKEAIIGFAQANGRLPCPANGSTATGAATAGVEQVTGSVCTLAADSLGAHGVVPWATLGVPESDAWGRRFSYRVSPAYADLYAASTWETKTTTTPAGLTNGDQNSGFLTTPLPCAPNPAPAAASFALCTVGDIDILSPNESTRTATPTAAIAVAKGIPVVIVSHGKNGYGAFQALTGIKMVNPTGAHELANVTGTPATTSNATWFASYAYYSRIETAQATTCSDTATGAPPFCEFDDVVAWISPSTLIARMVSAGKLP